MNEKIHLFVGIGDRHGPNEVFCVFQVLSENLKRCKGVLLCFYAENGVEFLIVFVQLVFFFFCAAVVVGFVFAFAQICCKIIS